MLLDCLNTGSFQQKVISIDMVSLEILTGYAISKFNINGSTNLIAHVSDYAMRVVFMYYIMSFVSIGAMTQLFLTFWCFHEQVWSLFKLNKATDILDCGHLGITYSQDLKEALHCIKVALLCIENEPSFTETSGYRRRLDNFSAFVGRSQRG